MTFAISQDNSAGLKTTLSVVTMDGSNLSDSKDAVFTVVTSPDSDKAKMWGHMPETFTNSQGVEFKRPLLRAELSSTTDTLGFTENNESRYTEPLSEPVSGLCQPVRSAGVADGK